MKRTIILSQDELMDAVVQYLSRHKRVPIGAITIFIEIQAKTPKNEIITKISYEK